MKAFGVHQHLQEHPDSHIPHRGQTSPAAAPRSSGLHSQLLRLGALAGNAAIAEMLDVPPRSRRCTEARLPVQRKYVLPADQAAAASTLTNSFPGLQIDGNVGDKDDQFWERYMRQDSVPITLSHLIASLLADFLGPDQRENVEISLFTEGSSMDSSESQGVRFQVATKAPLIHEDKRPFTLTQAYQADHGRLKVHVETVVAPKRGRQFVKSSLLAQARLLGAARITLLASSIGGSQEGVFVWARYGFIPTTGDWDAMRRWGLRNLADWKPRLGQLDADVEKVLLDPAPVAIRRLVYMSWASKGEITTFLNQMLSSNVNWHGELDLTDPSSLAWITMYAEAEEFQKFLSLLPEASREVAPPPEPPTPEPLDDLGPTEPTFDEDEMVAILVANIKSEDASLTEVEEEYGAIQPSLVAKVKKALLEQK